MSNLLLYATYLFGRSLRNVTPDDIYQAEIHIFQSEKHGRESRRCYVPCPKVDRILEGDKTGFRQALKAADPRHEGRLLRLQRRSSLTWRGRS